MFCSTMFQTPPLKYTVPGDTTLTRIFLGAYCRANPFAMCTSAALIGPYELALSACAAETDAMMRKAPSPRCSPLASRNGLAGSHALTAPNTSDRQCGCHDAASPPRPIAP